MTSIAETESGTTGIDLRETEPDASQNFNLRAYLAGGAATTALIAGAIVVFASLGTYVAFNGLPIGSGNENASQLTIGAGAGAAAAPAGPDAVLGRAPGAVAATAAASATAPANAQSDGGAGASGGSVPGSTGTSPSAPAPATIDTSPSPVPAGETESASGPVDQIGNAANVPLGEATDPVTGPAAEAVGDALDGVGAVLGTPQQGGQAPGGAAGQLLSP